MREALKLCTIPLFSGLGIWILYLYEKMAHGPGAVLGLSYPIGALAAIVIICTCAYIDHGAHD